jgi:hypothetical protein
LEKISEGTGSGSPFSEAISEPDEERPVDRPGSKVKFLEVEDNLPPKPPTAPSKVSSMGFASEIRAFSRDAIKEREKINTEARGKLSSTSKNLTLLPGLSTGLSSSGSEIASENGLPLPVPSEIFSNFDLESSSSSSMSARDLTPGVVDLVSGVTTDSSLDNMVLSSSSAVGVNTAPSLLVTGDEKGISLECRYGVN